MNDYRIRGSVLSCTKGLSDHLRSKKIDMSRTADLVTATYLRDTSILSIRSRVDKDVQIC